MKRSKQYIILLCILTILISLWVSSLRTEHYKTSFASPSPSPSPYLFASPSPSPSPYLFASPSPSPYLQKRLALIIRGEGFRKGGQFNRDHGKEETYEEQKKACETHMQLIKKIESAGYAVDVYINSYNTKFNKDLESWYGGYLKKSRFHHTLLESQAKMWEDSIQLVNSQGIHYDAMFMIRLDLIYKPKFIQEYNPNTQTIQFLNIAATGPDIKKSLKGLPLLNDASIHFPKIMYHKIPTLFTGLPDRNNAHFILDTNPLELHTEYSLLTNSIFDANSLFELNDYYKITGRAESDKAINGGRIYPRDF